MPKAFLGNVLIAQSDKAFGLDGTIYFPRESVDFQYLEENGTTMNCPWRGVANLYNVVVNGEISKDGAYTFPDPKPAAEKIHDHIAFWKGIEVVD